MKNCCVKTCKNKLNYRNDLHFHSFPSNLKIRNKWILSVGKNIEDFKASGKYVCSDHFKKTDYSQQFNWQVDGSTQSRKRLEKEAVPSIFKCNIEGLQIEDSKFDPEEYIDKLFLSEIEINKEPTTTELNDILKEKVSSLENCVKEKEKIIATLEKTIEILRKKINTAEIDSVNNIKKKLKHVLSSNQIDVALGLKTRITYTEDEISTALTLRYHSKMAYLYLRNKKNYPLPGFSTLQRLSSSVDMTTGILQDVLKMLTIAGTSMSDKEKDNCVLIYNEIRVKKTYEYDVKHDKIRCPCSYMVVVMLRSLFGSWRTPIAVEFDTTITNTYLEKLMTALNRIHFNVIACVSDCATPAQGKYKDNDNTLQTHMFHPNTNKKVYFFVDAPHLLKLFRNWLLDTGFTLSNGFEVTSAPLWKIVNRKFISDNEKLGEKSAWFFTEDLMTVNDSEHKSVSKAAQVISKRTAEILIQPAIHITHRRLKHLLVCMKKNKWKSLIKHFN